METSIESAKRSRVDPDRSVKLAELAALRQELSEIDSALESAKSNDPQQVEAIIAQARLNAEAANRWTDNIFAIKSYLTKKKGMSSKEVMHLQFYC